jgi:hypothetical protein
MTPKTIQIFLPSGDPQGIRIAEITTRIVQLIEVPRSLLPDFLKMPESDQVALYFLFSEEEDGSERKVYVGQTGDLRARLTKHHKEKFGRRWCYLRTNSLPRHALFLAHPCRKPKAGRYSTENGNEGNKPHTPTPLEADCLRYSRRAYLAGAPPSLTQLPSPVSAMNLLQSFGADGRGMYTEEGRIEIVGRKEMLLLKGTARLPVVDAG